MKYIGKITSKYLQPDMQASPPTPLANNATRWMSPDAIRLADQHIVLMFSFSVPEPAYEVP
jgi:hypothetical protein